MALIQQTSNFPPNFDGTMVDAGPAPPPQQRRGNPPARRGGLPVPPPQPASDPNMLQTDVPADPLSPVTLILNYLKSRGYQPTAENIRRTVEANARDPGVLGADPVAGLRNARPSTEAEDQAAMAAAGRGRGGGGPSDLVQESGSFDPTGSKTSSAPATTPSALPTPAMMPRIIEPITDVSPAVRLGGGGGGGGGSNPAIEPPPTTPIADSVTKALEGPPGQLALPAPPVPRLPPPEAMPNPGVPVPEPAPIPALAPPAPPPPPNITTSSTLRTPAVPTPPPPVPPPSTFGSRALENFRAGGGVRGALRGSGGKLGGVGGAIMLGTGAKDIYDEWQRQHSGQTPPGS